MWSLGGLSFYELLKRTVKESWQDGLFGQSAQLAFYHFMAVFPALLLLLLPMAYLAKTGAEMRQLLMASFRQFLPEEAAVLVTGTIRDLQVNASSAGGLLLLAVAGAVWAGINGCWAMIVGLNTAYETREDRRWRDIVRVAAGLAFALLLLVFAALLVVYYADLPLRYAAVPAVLMRLAHWIVITAVLLISFGLYYRFGPNLKNREWQWSTPGAVFGATLWIAATLLVREYFDRFAPYHPVYGRAAAPATLLMWLYITNAVVLIGAEMNSEIEKADENRGGQQRARGPRK